MTREALLQKAREYRLANWRHHVPPGVADGSSDCGFFYPEETDSLLAGFCLSELAAVTKELDDLRRIRVRAKSSWHRRQYMSFWRNTSKTGECWLWMGHRGTHGYGRISVNGKGMTAHRYSWTLHNGPIPEGKMVLHRCDNPPCVRPGHLFLGTHADNMADMVRKGRRRVVRVVGDNNGSRKHPERLLRGEKNHKSKLTIEQVRTILGRAGESHASLAREFGVTTPAIRKIVKGLSWRAALHREGPEGGK